MPSELRPLRELCSLIADCPHSTPVWANSGYFVIRNQNIKNGRLDLSAPSFTDAQHFAHRTRRAKPTSGDIIFTREAPMGEVCMVPGGLECCVGQRQVLLRPNAKIVDGRFLLYALQSPQVQHEIGWNEGTGSTVSNVRIPVLEALRIPTPHIEIQREVAEVLGTLDDTISLLRETNATLEAIAQALFKSWFIDFDPVRAKAEGREPEGVPPEIAALFPSEFEDSALGEIPKGWRVGSFGGLADVLGGGTPSTKEPTYWEGGVHCWVTPKDLSGMDTSVLLGTERKITDAGLNKISSGLLPIGTVLMSSRAPIGYIAIAEMPVAINQGFIAMMPKAGISNLFLLNLVRSRMDEIKSHANGSTFMEISKAAFRPLKVVEPPVPVIQAYDSIARSLYARLVENQRQVGSLAEIRDALLPRLMSGKLRLTDDKALLETI